MEDSEVQALRPLDSGGECGGKQNHEGGSEITHAVGAPLSSPSMKLALSVRCDSTDEKLDRSVTMDRKSDCWLTPIQSLELRLQTHIYKHLAGGLPLPLHLANPLWKNVATYLGSNKSAIYHNDQSCIEFGSEELKHKYAADPESVRCRRTDGKKWRCRKNSIPKQKYCERHIHRGCQCSRKSVEEHEINSPPSISPAPSRISHSQSKSKNSICSAPVKLITTSIVTESTANLTRVLGKNKNRASFANKKTGTIEPEPEPEPERCRRTDGKKWRCSRGAIPDQKYCGIHMHRGSIKKFKSYHNDVSMIPNTNLSMSIQPSHHRPKRIEEKNSSSSGSETTISDTTILC